MKNTTPGIIFLSTLIVTVTLAGCTSNTYKVGKLESLKESHGRIGASEIGLNNRGEAVYQTKTAAADELRLQQWENNKITADVKAQRYMLDRCRKDLADSRLGGNGSMTPIPSVEDLTSATSGSQSKLGMDNRGKLSFVKKEYLLDRIEKEREFNTSLKKLLVVVKESKDDCELKMGQSRVEAGLPAKRFTAKGFFRSDGSWVQTRKPEASLDDAFEIVRNENN